MNYKLIFEEKFLSIFNDLKNIKYFILLYIIILSLFSISFLQIEDYLNPVFEISVFCLLILLGIISLIYYNRNKKNLYKVAFLIIIIFGIVSVFLTPITDVSDENEHFVRAEIVSQGQVLTDYVNVPNTTGNGYKTIESVSLFYLNSGINVFNTGVDDQKINYSTNYFNSAFAQNPFYGYLAQGIGIDIAKLFDLNAIWMLWIGRFFNLLLYGVVCAIAIKKSPIFKLPLTLVACLPLAIYQGASMSIDASINAFGILTIAYFFLMYKSPKKSIKWKDIGIFYIACMLCGLIKSPYLLLCLLILIVPRKNFINTKQCVISKISVVGVFLIGIAWNFGYATYQLSNSWRGDYFIKNNVSPSGQIEYIKQHPLISTERFLGIINTIPYMFNNLFFFSNGPQAYFSNLLGTFYGIFFCIFSLIYPLSVKIRNSDRIKAFIIAALIYISTFVIQYLTWSSVGGTKITAGVFGRYFIPLLVFLPFIFGINNENIDNKKIKLLTMTIAISFISGMLMLTTAVKY